MSIQQEIWLVPNVTLSERNIQISCVDWLEYMPYLCEFHTWDMNISNSWNFSRFEIHMTQLSSYKYKWAFMKVHRKWKWANLLPNLVSKHQKDPRALFTKPETGTCNPNLSQRQQNHTFVAMFFPSSTFTSYPYLCPTNNISKRLHGTPLWYIHLLRVLKSTIDSLFWTKGSWRPWKS